MVNSARMLKTLGCLVAAMIGTNALLGAIDPSLPTLSATLNPEQLRDLALAVVTEGVEVQGRRWERIEVVSGPPSTGRMLAAQGSSSTAHFVIESGGRPARTVRWRDQSVSAASPGAIRVELAGGAEHGASTEQQTDGLRALADALTLATGRRPHSLPVLAADSNEPLVIGK